ncbi:olfactory receptor 6F1-like [Hyperolius riggenbachi]|uniref:olfactory receptor 6F1-like n=1 Tax=Hyperolius riggenbachi TaxID=752182 RepID=UPI0035A36CAA
MVPKQQFNQSGVTNFLLLGFSLMEETRFCLLIVLSAVYITTIAANVSIIVLIRAESRLHKPMYFFIGGLSFLEIWYPSVTVPRLLWSLKTKDQYISSAGCMAQFYFHFSLGTTEMFLLTAMAYDRYVAICNPLRYLTIMSPYICTVLILGSWSCGFIAVVAPCISISTFWFCDGNKVDHYYCDFAPVVRLSCSDTLKAENVFFYSALFIIVGCLLFTLTSYACITRTIINCPTASGRRKAFSTFASHLSVVTLFYGTVMFMFIRPASVDSLHLNKIISIIPSVVTPLLNPIIYTLRNQEVMEAVLRATRRIMTFQEEG